MVSQRDKKKIVIAMSGGVDSSVAAMLLAEQYEDVSGIFLRFWKDETAGEFSPIENRCCSARAESDARAVCRRVGISFYALDLRREFKRDVVDYFLAEYAQGHTPNPCVPCNKFVKLGLLIEKARELGYDRVASGHYARLCRKKRTIRLLRAKDRNKDQSYFLYTLTQEQLRHLLFPLGEYTKKEVRKKAQDNGLPVSQKKESSEVCFIPDKGSSGFLKRHLRLKPGPINSSDGKTIGEHRGLPLYTIGQRKGIEIGGTGPYYVTRCDYGSNILYVSNNPDSPALYRDRLAVRGMNWITGIEPKLPLKCEAVIRYRQEPTECEVTRKPDASDYNVKFKKPQRAVTPGQSIVLYNRDEVMGGGVIAE